MVFMLSERESYGTGYHAVMSLSNWLLIPSVVKTDIVDKAMHFLVALHTHGFRHHVHIVLWTEDTSIYSRFTKLARDTHVTKINKTFFKGSSEIDCSQGYNRVIDYVLRDEHPMYYETGNRNLAYEAEYLGELNKSTLKLEKEAKKTLEENYNDRNNYPYTYYYQEAAKLLGLTGDETFEEFIERDNK